MGKTWTLDLMKYSQIISEKRVDRRSTGVNSAGGSAKNCNYDGKAKVHQRETVRQSVKMGNSTHSPALAHQVCLALRRGGRCP